MYLALYRKYRPQVFDDVISQEHITTTLKNQLKSGQTAHAYIFTGSRGTGKTTCAKILAKAVNCLHPVDGNPCLECEICRAVEDGASDVTEIDAASNSGVDNVRGLKEEAMYAPITCKRRVYIIDEVHMLSVSAFNALLKLIEEPPPHVVFIFATTEIHKVPVTILSRCQRFEFRRIDINDSKRRLLEVAQKENMKLSDDAAYLISRISDGGMRDALSLLDQCFSVSDNVTEEVVRNCAGISGTEHLFRIADAAASRNASAALGVLRELTERSKSPARLIDELISHYRILMLMKAGADISTLKITAKEAEGYARQNERYTLEMLMRALSVLGEALTGMSRARSEELLCEMCLIKLCTPKLDTDEKALSGRIDALEKLVNDALRELKSAPQTSVLAIQAPVQSAAPAPSVPEPIYPGVITDAPTGAEPFAATPMPDAAQPAMPEAAAMPKAPEPVINFPKQSAVPDVTAPVQMPIDLPFDLDAPEPVPAGTFPTAAEEGQEPATLQEALGMIPPPDEPPIPVPEPIKPAAESFAPPPPAGEMPPLPEGYEPFIEWKEILDSMPPMIKLLIGDTTAMINGSTVLVCGNELQKGYAVSDYSEELKQAVSRAIGRKVTITAQPDSAVISGGRSRLEEFLDYAKGQGIKIKEE